MGAIGLEISDILSDNRRFLPWFCLGLPLPLPGLPWFQDTMSEKTAGSALVCLCPGSFAGLRFALAYLCRYLPVDAGTWRLWLMAQRLSSANILVNPFLQLVNTSSVPGRDLWAFWINELP